MAHARPARTSDTQGREDDERVRVHKSPSTAHRNLHSLPAANHGSNDRQSAHTKRPKRWRDVPRTHIPALTPARHTKVMHLLVSVADRMDDKGRWVGVDGLKWVLRKRLKG